MLFNSLEFILFFFPITLLIFFVIGSRGNFLSRQLAISWLLFSSLFFYSFWNRSYLPILLISILANYMTGELLGNDKVTLRGKKYLLFLGIFFNISLIAYFKYANFFIDNINAILGENFRTNQILLPLGISFFTFQQIAYLVDAYRSKAEACGPLKYCLFVSFFPQLIAGPIVHHGDFIPQFFDKSIYKFNSRNVAIGLTIFIFGLSKKVLFADSISVYATPVFDAAMKSTVPLLDAWIAALSYSLQLYFDFSGYSDMAIGLALCFNIKLPLNFNSPYQAVSISDFWRRWHITLSNFLRDYLYIPLGGSRKGELRRTSNLMLTMILGGFWHGAGWTFIFWGALHGFYLSVNHQWRLFLKYLGKDNQSNHWLMSFGGWFLTFILVVFGWVLFRAESIDSAFEVFRGMLGFSGISNPNSPLSGMISIQLFLLLFFLLVVVWLAPNTQELMGKYGDNPSDIKTHKLLPWLKHVYQNFSWQPSSAWGLAMGAIAFLMVKNLFTASGSEFLYFNF